METTITGNRGHCASYKLFPAPLVAGQTNTNPLVWLTELGGSAFSHTIITIVKMCVLRKKIRARKNVTVERLQNRVRLVKEFTPGRVGGQRIGEMGWQQRDDVVSDSE